MLPPFFVFRKKAIRKQKPEEALTKCQILTLESRRKPPQSSGYGRHDLRAERTFRRHWRRIYVATALKLFLELSQ